MISKYIILGGRLGKAKTFRNYLISVHEKFHHLTFSQNFGSELLPKFSSKVQTLELKKKFRILAYICVCVRLEIVSRIQSIFKIM